MSTLGTKTGIGDYFMLGDKVLAGLWRCNRDNPLDCGNCPYCFLKDDEKSDITKCTSALVGDAIEFIRSLYKFDGVGEAKVIETLDNNYCEVCCSPVIGGDNYCHECGRKLIWDD